MLTFGPLSSLFDFLTFAVLLHILHAEAAEFRTGWFVESLATQTLIIFVIRTHAQPFWRSHPSLLLVGRLYHVPTFAAVHAAGGPSVTITLVFR